MGSVCVIDGEFPDFLKETNHIRRRGMGKCEICGNPIRPEQRYHKIVGMWEGDIVTHTSHLECHLLMQWAAEVLCGEAWYDLNSTLDIAEQDLIAYNAGGVVDFPDEALKSWLLELEKTRESLAPAAAGVFDE